MAIPIRHPVKMSDFQERPKFYLPEQRILSQHSGKYLDPNQTVLSQGVFEVVGFDGVALLSKQSIVKLTKAGINNLG